MTKEKEIEELLKEIGFREGGDYFAIYPFHNGDFRDCTNKADIEIQELEVEEFIALVKKIFLAGQNSQKKSKYTNKRQSGRKAR